MKFYSHGKVLLTAEYAVMEGVKALALPTQKGQSLDIKYTNNQSVVWRSFTHDKKLWMHCIFNFDFECIEHYQTDTVLIRHLVQILKQLNQLSPQFYGQGIAIETHLDFPRNWGLGSSSTLIFNLAQWLAINPYELLDRTMGGSGYDIAVANYGCPLFYTRMDYSPAIEPVEFFPVFTDQLFFVHLNKKQKSSEAILSFQRDNRLTPHYKKRLAAIGASLVKVNDQKRFNALLFEHEKIIAHALNTPPIQEQLFSDFKGQIKSLGAWGGDFILASGDKNTPSYFQQKGYPTVFSYTDFILTKKSPQ